MRKITNFKHFLSKNTVLCNVLCNAESARLYDFLNTAFAFSFSFIEKRTAAIY